MGVDCGNTDSMGNLGVGSMDVGDVGGADVGSSILMYAGDVLAAAGPGGCLSLDL